MSCGISDKIALQEVCSLGFIKESWVNAPKGVDGLGDSVVIVLTTRDVIVLGKGCGHIGSCPWICDIYSTGGQHDSLQHLSARSP